MKINTSVNCYEREMRAQLTFSVRSSQCSKCGVCCG